MQKNRLEAFSDAVIAIILTIMVLELKVPHGTDLHALRPLVPVFGAYLMSYVYLGTYWNNHHHMLHATDHIDGKILWANLHLLFWLSLIPFSTGWLADHELAAVPTALYGVVLLCAAIAYTILQSMIIAHGGPNKILREAVGRDRKGKLSIVAYAVAVAVAFIEPVISVAVYIAVLFLWFIPDRRIERKLGHSH